MDAFVPLLHQAFAEAEATLHAWVLLPNHYHVLATIAVLPVLSGRLGQLHGSTSSTWNGEDNARGRKCWHRVSDRAMRSEAHFWATVNYIHHNAVKHGYVSKWTDWPWSSAQDFLREQGREDTLRIWRDYPLGEYGVGWDD
jgi:putative transposase